VSPGVDYFLADHFSIGLAGTFTSSSSTGVDPSTGLEVDSSTQSGGPSLRLGLDLPLGEWLSVWARASLGVGLNAYDEKSGSSENKYNENVAWVGLYVPLLVHPAPHFFVGLGPSVSRDLDRSVGYSTFARVENRSMTVGAGLVMGGWLGE